MPPESDKTTKPTTKAFAIFAWGEPSEAEAEILEPTCLHALSSSSTVQQQQNIHQLSWATPSDPCSAFLLTTSGRLQLWRPKRESGQSRPHPGGWFPRNLENCQAVAWTDYDQHNKIKSDNKKKKNGAIVQISSGNRHHAAVTREGHLLTWGTGYTGQLGLGEDSTTMALPTRVVVVRPSSSPSAATEIQFTSVTCNINCTLAVTRTGQVWKMGAVHNEPPAMTPIRVTGFGEKKNNASDVAVVVTQVSLGSRHAAAVTEDHELYTWGASDCGQLGHCSTLDEAQPTRVDVVVVEDDNNNNNNNTSLPSCQIRQVSCGSVHTAAVTTNGHVVVWGDDSYGQMGCRPASLKEEEEEGQHQQRPCLSTPTRVRETLESLTIEKVSCVSSSTFAITDEGELYSWGCGFGGRLGNGSTQHVGQPQLVTALIGRRVVDVVGSGSTPHVTTALVERPQEERRNDTIPFDTVAFGVAVNNPELSDVSFILEKHRTIYAHRFPLAQRSEYFKRMFLSGMQESTSQAAVHVDNVRYDVFLALLHYLYTGHLVLGGGIEDCTESSAMVDADAIADDAMDLYQLSDMYELPKLQSLCWQAVQDNMTVDNAGFLLVKADDMSNDALKKMALKYIRRKFDQVSQTEAMLGVHPRLWQEITQGLRLEKLG